MKKIGDWPTLISATRPEAKDSIGVAHSTRRSFSAEERSVPVTMEQTPLDEVEALHARLVREHYGSDADRAELRAAAKLLMVAILQFRDHGGPHWHRDVLEYVNMALHQPDRFARVVDSNRGRGPRRPDKLPA